MPEKILVDNINEASTWTKRENYENLLQVANKILKKMVFSQGTMMMIEGVESRPFNLAVLGSNPIWHLCLYSSSVKE